MYLVLLLIHLHLTFTFGLDEVCSDPCCCDGWCLFNNGTQEKNRCFFQNVNQYYPVKIASKGNKPVNRLRYSSSDKFKNWVESFRDEQDFTILDRLEITNTDAFLVMHKGEMVYERYWNQLESTRHAMFSGTKSFVALTAAILAHDGLLDPEEFVVNYVPELENIDAFENATVRHLMDMTLAIDYQQTPFEPDTDYIKYIEILVTKGTHIALKESLKPHPNRTHGDVYEYSSPVIDTLGWVLDNILGGNGRTFEYFAENIWSKLGQEHDLLIAMWDMQYHIANHAIGALATARDMMRFAQMMANMGKTADGIQIVPWKVVQDIMNGGTDDNVEQFKNGGGCGPYATSFRNAFRVNADEGFYFSMGIHGQLVWVDTANDYIVVKQSSNEHEFDNLGSEYNLIIRLKNGLRDSTDIISNSKNSKKSKTSKKSKKS